MTSLLWLLIGLAGVWLGCEIAVMAALRLAERYGLSQMFVGTTIMAIGTDVPELVVAVTVAVNNLRGTEASGVLIGAAVGSCFAQISLVLGTAGLLSYLTIGKRVLWRDGVTLVGSAVLLGLTAFDLRITRVEGGVLLTTYAMYLLTVLKQEGQRPRPEPHLKAGGRSPFPAILLGLAMVALFAHVTVSAAIDLSRAWGIEQSFVGFVLIGLGTSLPELALSVKAITKKAGALSVGNILGSNVFDTLVPVGLAAVIAPLAATSPALLRLDLPALVGITLITLMFFGGSRRGLQKGEAMFLVLAYLAFAAVKVATA